MKVGNKSVTKRAFYRHLWAFQVLNFRKVLCKGNESF